VWEGGKVGRKQLSESCGHYPIGEGSHPPTNHDSPFASLASATSPRVDNEERVGLAGEFKKTSDPAILSSASTPAQTPRCARQAP